MKLFKKYLEILSFIGLGLLMGYFILGIPS